MTKFQNEVGTWGDKTFPGGTPESIVAHLRREVKELAASHDPEEAADCFLLLLHHAHRAGYDLLAEARKKLEINKKRQWGEPDENGIVEHIRTETKSPVCEDCGGELRESPSGIRYCRIHGIQCKQFKPSIGGE